MKPTLTLDSFKTPSCSKDRFYTVRFLWRLMQHYDGGAAYLRHACACCDTASTSTGVKVERSCRSRSRGMSLAQTKKYATGQVGYRKKHSF